MATFTGPGQNDSGGQALPNLSGTTSGQINWGTVATPIPSTPTFGFTGTRGPTNSGVLYQTGGGGATSGYGQIFPSGRS